MIGSFVTRENFVDIIRREATVIDGIWCWRGICPGRTTVAEAKAAVLALGGELVIDQPDQLRIEYPQGYNLIMDNREGKPGPIAAIFIDISDAKFPSVSLGNVVANFGTPRFVRSRVAQGRPTWQRDIGFAPYLWIYVNGTQPRLEPQLPVTEIEFLGPERDPYTGYPDYYQLWKGFVALPQK